MPDQASRPHTERAAVARYLTALDRLHKADTRRAELRQRRDLAKVAAEAVLAEAIAAGRLPERPDPAVLARIAGMLRGGVVEAQE